MASDVVVRNDGPGDRSPKGPERASTGNGSGFFTIYKKGQGYWTRMGTAGAAALIGLLTVYNIFHLGPMFGVDDKRVLAISAGVFGIAFVVLVAWLMNKPTNAEFLIATDSEMKKVNWTSRKELIGSTKVVIGFMFIVALFLFGVDQLFQTFFYLIDVIKIEPFFLGK